MCLNALNLFQLESCAINSSGLFACAMLCLLLSYSPTILARETEKIRMMVSHNYSNFLFKNVAAVNPIFVTTCTILFLMVPVFALAGERADRISNTIETGSSRADSFLVNRMSVIRTRNDTLEDAQINYFKSPNHLVSLSQTNIPTLQNDNEFNIQNSAVISANSGEHSASIDSQYPNLKSTRITLRALGLLQLAAHDFFNVNRITEIDAENGDLDLSTLLDHGYDNIAIGGEPRKRENIILFTVAKEFGELYLKILQRGYSPEMARSMLIRKYHAELEDIFEELFQEDFPKPISGPVTQTENLAFRTIHDLLPGKINVDGLTIDTLDNSLVGKTLTRNELKKKSGKLDGTFDPEFLNIVIFIPPATLFQINLLDRDSSFALQFSTTHTFEHFLTELADGSYDSNEDVTQHIKNLFAKGLYF
jgi:hypothetical protein